jgi:L-asparaginase II
MTNPVLVEVTRGGIVESRHRGAIAVVDASGGRVVAIGDVEAPVFPRSAVKAIQALPLVESGAADAYGFGAAELALASASHSGEPRHVQTVTAMLAAAGRSVVDLECGVQIPMSSLADRMLLRGDHLPSPLHNNCSGKHAGFICTACHLGVDPKGYVLPDHPIQRAVTAALAELTGAELGAANRGIDGCSIPAYAIPLDRLARAFARMGTGEGLGPARAAAAKRILESCMAEPFMVAGSGRFDTDVMPLFPGHLFVKGGAEGVYCGAFPEAGFGIAIKIDDGASRASEVAMAAVIASRLTPSDDAARTAFARWLAPPVRNRRGIAELLDALARGAG